MNIRSHMQRKETSLNALYKVQQDRGYFAMLCASHMAMLKASMFSSKCKHSCDLYLKCLPPAPSLHIFTLLQSIVDERL